MAVLQKGKKEPRNEGPFVKNLDRTLATFNVCRQAYTVAHSWVIIFIPH